MSKIFIAAGLLLNLLATGFLFLGSRHLPWDMQSIGGKTDKEKAFYDLCKKQTKIGFILLFLGFFFQLLGV